MISLCLFELNHALWNGGAAFAAGGTLIFFDTDVTNDNEAQRGGGLYVTAQGTARFLFGSIIGNQSHVLGDDVAYDPMGIFQHLCFAIGEVVEDN